MGITSDINSATLLFFSNEPQFLALKLEESLFSNGSKPLEKRTIVVPSSAVKTFLSQFFCRKEGRGIFAAVKIVTPNELIGNLLKENFAKTSYRLPSLIELTFLIQELLLQNRLEELEGYLGGMSLPKELIRLSAAAKKLAEFFLQLDELGGDFLSSEEFSKSWKCSLLKELFPEESGFVFIHQILGSLNVEGSLHVFGFSYLSKMFCDFFIKKGAHFYLFSPCKEYWEDFCTGREKAKYHRWLSSVSTAGLNAFDEMTQDQHPLLAGYGQGIRKFLKNLSYEDIQSNEHYEEPKKTTLLAKLQASLLNGEMLREIDFYDNSLQVHTCSSKLREVEVLLDSLYGYMEAFPDLTSQDILIVAPDLNSYIPYIQMVFGKEDSKLGFSFSSASNSSELLLFFNELIFPKDYRLEKEKILTLLGISAFRRKLSWSSEDIGKILFWIEEMGVTWGFDAAHQQRIAQDPHLEERGTWETGFSSLLQGFIHPQEGFSLPAVELELLGSFITCMKNLHLRLMTLFTEEKTPSEWFLFVKEICEEFFYLDNKDQSLIYGLENLRVVLDSLERKIPFTLVAPQLQEFLLQQEGSKISQKGNRIHFHSLYSASMAGHKVIGFLGMDEEAIPTERDDPLWEDWIFYQKVESPLQKREKARCVFLEALCVASDAVWISYTKWDAQHNLKEPTSMVGELLSFVSEEIVMEHPSCGFAKSYFEENRSFSKPYFELALSLEKQNAPLIPFSLPKELEVEEMELKPGIYEITIGDFLAFMKDRERFYQKSILGIFMPWEEETSLSKDLTISLKQRKRLQRRSALSSLDLAWEEEKSLPKGLFGSLAYSRYLEAVDQPIKISEIFSLKVDPSCLTIEKRNNFLIAPAICFAMGEGIEVRFHGTLPDIAPEGILFFEDKAKKSSEKASAVLGLLAAQNFFENAVAPRVLFLPKGKIQDFEPKDTDIFLRNVKSFLIFSKTQAV